jgi:hypothetical protein
MERSYLEEEIRVDWFVRTDSDETVLIRNYSRHAKLIGIFGYFICTKKGIDESAEREGLGRKQQK